MWRSGSTYVWSRFRDAPGTRCFYEPLHEGLSRLTHARISRETPDTALDLRHPPMRRPYFSEYAPLLSRRGVVGHRQAFARDRYALAADERHPRLKHYLDSLIDHARGDGLTPVLGFNGTNFRLPWLDRLFRPFNLYVERDPAGIWASYVDHAAHGNFTFFKNWGLILERNRKHPILAPIAAHAPLRASLRDLWRHPKRHYARAIRAMEPHDLYLMVHYLWLASLVQAAVHCDMILDVSAAGADAVLAKRAERFVRQTTGVPVDFSTCVAAAPRVPLDDDVRRKAERKAIDLLPASSLRTLRELLPKADLSLLSQPKQRLLEALGAAAAA